MYREALFEIFMKKNWQTLPERLSFIAADRKMHPWAKSIGINRGTVEAMMNKGGMPGAETLRAINRCENASMEWLLEGRGNPFYVTACGTDLDAREALADLIESETWEATIVTDENRMALVLTQPGSFDIKDQRIDYTILEVIVGTIGRQTISDLRNRAVHAAGISQFYYVNTDVDTMNKLEGGQLGTYRICLAADALLSTKSPVLVNAYLVEKLEKFIKPSSGPKTMQETDLIESFRSLSADEREAVLKIAEKMAGGSKS